MNALHKLLLAGLYSMTCTTSFAASQNVTGEPQLDERLGVKAEPSTDNHQSPKPDLAYGAFQRGMYLTAFKLALPRAEAGDSAAQTLIAELYDRGLGIAYDPAKAAEWYEVAANSGDRSAQFALALKLLEGKGVKRDIKRGAELMKESAEAGFPLAMFNYATALIENRPTTAGYRMALPFMEKAAQLKVKEAYFPLSRIYRDGLATGIGDADKANKWLLRAAESGDANAQIELGYSYLNGLGVEKNTKQAFRWYDIAARQGNSLAQERLAHLYFTGTGTEKNPVEGAKWYIMSNRAGRKDPALEQYMKYLDKDTYKQALTAANQWPF